MEFGANQLRMSEEKRIAYTWDTFSNPVLIRLKI